MDSTAQTAPLPSKIFNETASTRDLWIRQRKQPLWLQKYQRNCFHGLHMDSTAQTFPRDSEAIYETASMGEAWIRQRNPPLWTQKSSTKLLPWVTHGFDSPISPCGLRTSTKTESLSTQKSSTKMLSRVTHGFGSANSPCGLRNHE